jgi:hypothetical protein
MLQKSNETKQDNIEIVFRKARCRARYYVLKNVGETALSGLPRFWAASLFKTRQGKLYNALHATFPKPLTLFDAMPY